MTQLKYHAQDRHATWLELFFDLVFVASIGVITHHLAHTHHHHLDSKYILLYILEFLPVWWIWATHTLYSNRYDSDDRTHRLLSLIIMLLMVTMSALAGHGLSEKSIYVIGVFYIAIRLILSGLFLSYYWRAKEDPFPKHMALVIIAGVVISAISVLLDNPYRQIVFISGILFEMFMTALITTKTGTTPVHREHLVERVGLITIILLGESVISMVAGLNSIEWNPHNITATLTGFIMIGAIWWIYFDSFDTLQHAKRLKNGFILLYSNVLFLLGLGILASMIGHAILDDVAMDDFRVLAVSGMILLYLGKQITYYAVFPPYRTNIIINSTVCVAITFASTFLERPEYTLIGMTLGMFFYSFSNLKWTLTKDVSDYLHVK